MSEWQPIETAPKDGTIVLLHRGILCFGYYFVGADKSCGWITSKIARNHDLQTIEPPTHWMPLPAPPTETKR